MGQGHCGLRCLAMTLASPLARFVLFRLIAHVAFDHNDSLRSREFIISWLNHTPHATAVYASCSASTNDSTGISKSRKGLSRANPMHCGSTIAMGRWAAL